MKAVLLAAVLSAIALGSAHAAGTLSVTFTPVVGSPLTISRQLSDADVTRLLNAYQPGGGTAADAFASMVQSWFQATIQFVKMQEAAAVAAGTAPIVLQ